MNNWSSKLPVGANFKSVCTLIDFTPYIETAHPHNKIIAVVLEYIKRLNVILEAL